MNIDPSRQGSEPLNTYADNAHKLRDGIGCLLLNIVPTAKTQAPRLSSGGIYT